MLPTYENYIKDLVMRLNKLQSLAKQKIIQSKERNKKYCDQKANEKEFNLNDNVFRLKGGKIHKHEDQYTRPFKITQIYPSGNVKIQTSATKTDSLLRSFKEDSD